jgi:hypothetical protein
MASNISANRDTACATDFMILSSGLKSPRCHHTAHAQRESCPYPFKAAVATKIGM